MKKLLITCLSIGLVFQLYAQDEPRFLFENANFSAFGGPILEFSQVNGDFSVSNGGGGGLIINQAFFLGGYGLGLSNDVLDESDNLNIDLSHGGFWTGFMFNSDKIVHLGVSSKFGWGNLKLKDQTTNTTVLNDKIFVITPQVEVEANLLRWFKFNAGVGYRIVSGVGGDFLADDDLNSPQVTIGFLFGWFD